MTDPNIYSLQPLSLSIAEVIGAELSSQGDPLDRLRVWERRYSGVPLLRTLRDAAGIVEPYDRVTGADPEMPSAKAFYIGSLVGLRTVEACVRSRYGLIKAFMGVEVGVPTRSDADSLQLRHDLAQDIMELGGRHYHLRDAHFTAFFDRWEDRLVPDAMKQIYLRAGFGLALAFLDKRREMDVEAEFTSAIEAINAPSGVDWDAAFQQELQQGSD